MKLRLCSALMTAALVVASAVSMAHPGFGPGGPTGPRASGGVGRNGAGGGSGPCEAARCVPEQALDQACPCDSATNHGSYVRCVARTCKQLVAAGTIPRRCKGRVVSCAARSTCGKPGAVTCEMPESTCEPSGTCANDPTVTCTAGRDCGTRCRVVSSASDCETAGGTVGTVTSCCATCTTTTTTSSTTTSTSSPTTTTTL